jgi:hypothetical protein
MGMFFIGMIAVYPLIAMYFSTPKNRSTSNENTPDKNLKNLALQAGPLTLLSTPNSQVLPIDAYLPPEAEHETVLFADAEAELGAEPGAVLGASPEVRPATNTIDNGRKPSGYSFWPKRYTLRHVKGWGAGVSYGTNYTTAAMMIAPDYRVGRILPFVDLRGHRFDNNTYAANIGIAGRYIPSPDTFCQILGMNLFYDWRQGRKGNYQQIGLGLEMLGKRWDLRANGYAPISKTSYKTKCVFQYGDDFFMEHRECEFISYGFNGEVGYYVVRNDYFFLYAATGPYYLVRKCHESTGGWQFRMRPQYKDFLAVDLSVSHDHVFETVYQAQIIFYLPLYKLSKRINKRPCNLSDQQIYQPIERFEVMPLGRRSCWRTNF